MNRSFISKIKSEKYFYHLRPSTNKQTIYNSLFVESDRWRYGDLYGLCYLPQYKIPLQPFKKYIPSPAKATTNRVLYIIGDSFLADKELNGAFDAFDYVVFLDRRFPFGPVKLDSTKKNYMILEFAERNLAQYFNHESTEVKWTNQQIKAKSQFDNTQNTSGNEFHGKPLIGRIYDILFNPDLNRNLQTVLFENKFSTPFREIKAQINYNLFNRLPIEVSESTFKDRLFLNTTVDLFNSQSAFKQTSDDEISKTCYSLKVEAAYYKSLGFKSVALSVIPNPVSVYNGKRARYNHLLERIQTQINIPAIDIFKSFKSSRKNLFYLSDSHWNPDGLDIWVTNTNAFLNNIVLD